MTEPKRRFRAAIIGAGHIAPFHIAGIRRSGVADVVALCDLDQPQAQQLANQFQIPHVVSQAADLKALGVDVIHVATPPNSHFALTMQALDMGCHVLVEKPLATSVEHCQSIARRAAEVNRQVCANHSNLLDPFIARTIAIARSGRIGEVLSVTYLRSSNYPPYRGGPLPPHYRDGGFPFRDIGVHAIYLIRALLGDINDVDAQFAHRGDDPNLMFDDWTGTVACNRGVGLFHLSWNVRPLQNVLIVTGTRGVIRCDPFSMFVTMRRKTKLPNAADRILGPIVEACQALTQVPWNLGKVVARRLRRYHGVQALIQEFYHSLHKGMPAPVSIEDATEAVRWTEQTAQPADEEKQRRLSRIPALMGADVLVTGGSGFIGGHLLRRLLDEHERVRVLMRSVPSRELLDDQRLEVVVGDLGDAAVVNRAVDGVKLVYHLGAAMKGPTEDFERGTLVGTRNIVDAVLRQPDIRLVYVSSLSVLHSSLAKPGDVVTESWPLEPKPENRGNYTLFKLRAEQLVSQAVREHGLRALIVRPGQVFGPNTELLTPAVARRMGSRLVVLGDGSVSLPLVYVEDLVDALTAAARCGPFDGTVVQVVDDAASIDQNELLRRMHESVPASVIHVPRPIVYSLAFGVQTAFRLVGRHAPLNVYRVRSALSSPRFDSSRAKSVLGWSPAFGVDQGLRECFAASGINALENHANGINGRSALTL